MLLVRTVVMPPKMVAPVKAAKRFLDFRFPRLRVEASRPEQKKQPGKLRAHTLNLSVELSSSDATHCNSHAESIVCRSLFRCQEISLGSRRCCGDKLSMRIRA